MWVKFVAVVKRPHVGIIKVLMVFKFILYYVVYAHTYVGGVRIYAKRCMPCGPLPQEGGASLLALPLHRPVIPKSGGRLYYITTGEMKKENCLHPEHTGPTLQPVLLCSGQPLLRRFPLCAHAQWSAHTWGVVYHPAGAPDLAR